jgi:hypothetical protein
MKKIILAEITIFCFVVFSIVHAQTLDTGAPMPTATDDTIGAVSPAPVSAPVLSVSLQKATNDMIASTSLPQADAIQAAIKHQDDSAIASRLDTIIQLLRLTNRKLYGYDAI